MRLATLLLAFTILTGCFPHSAKNRRTAKWAEGGAIVAGVALLSVAGSGADCEFKGPAHREDYLSCGSKAEIVGNIGFGLILSGLLGFAITTMVVGDEKKPVAPVATDKPVPAVEDAAEDAPKPSLPGRTATRPHKH